MTFTRKRSTAFAVLTAAALLAAGCSSSKSTGGGTHSASGAPTNPNAKVTISVASLIPGSTAAATAQFNNQVKEFEAANPTITVKPTEYQWTGPTFAAKLAAGTLPTVFEVPFTDARTLGENGQLADLTSLAKALPYFNEYNPAVAAEFTTSAGKVIALPKGAYAQALHYNRKLFTEAGLDPNKPPTTWDQVEADAKQIAQKTGAAGYAEMGKSDNSAGWILTTIAYSQGARLETGTGTSAKATLNTPGMQAALNLIKTMRWTDNSMGSTFDYDWSGINQAFAAGKIGMYVSGSDVYTNLVQASNINPAIYGVTTIPLSGSPDAGVLGGGTLAAVRPNASADEKAAAMKWIDFYYEEPLVNKAQAIRNAQSLIASKQPVGVPAMPVFNQQQYNQSQEWIKSYINAPVAQMTPFTNNIFSQQLTPEPEASTQAVYHALDPVVQAVLTQRSANIDSLLNSANSVAQNAISQGQ